MCQAVLVGRQRVGGSYCVGRPAQPAHHGARAHLQHRGTRLRPAPPPAGAAPPPSARPQVYPERRRARLSAAEIPPHGFPGGSPSASLPPARRRAGSTGADPRPGRPCGGGSPRAPRCPARPSGEAAQGCSHRAAPRQRARFQEARAEPARVPDSRPGAGAQRDYVYTSDQCAPGSPPAARSCKGASHTPFLVGRSSRLLACL